MSKHVIASAIAAAALACPVLANAAIKFQFDGVVTPDVDPQAWIVYSDANFDTVVATTSFDAEPATLTFTVEDPQGAPWISDFNVSWTDNTYALPFITGWMDTGLSPEQADYVFGHPQSSVSLTPTGGVMSIQVFHPNNNWFGGFDLAYTLSQPHNPFSSFADPNVSGSGSAVGYQNLNFDPVIGFFDAESRVNFTLTGLHQFGVPEPGTWILLIGGFAGVGLAARAARRRSRVVTTA